jgi:hypothetical protein
MATTDVSVMPDGRIIIRQGTQSLEFVRPDETAAVLAALTEAAQVQATMLHADQTGT